MALLYKRFVTSVLTNSLRKLAEMENSRIVPFATFFAETINVTEIECDMFCRGVLCIYIYFRREQ